MVKIGCGLRTLADVLPWFLPGLVVTTAIALLVAGPVARHLRSDRWVAFLLVTSVGAVLAATIPPVAGGLGGRPLVAGRCDFGRIGLAPLAQYLQFSDTSLNVILFIPLGLATALLGRSTATGRVAMSAFAFPFAIEAIQSLLPILGRGCQSQDVVDNILGLGIGLALGLLTSLPRTVRKRTCSAHRAFSEAGSRHRQPRLRRPPAA
jgi:VanZ family protein